MKNKAMNTLAAVFTALVLLGASQAHAGLFGSMPLENPDHAYELDTWMENSEVYEFTPKSNPDITCVMYMLDSGKAMGLQCFPKDSPKTEIHVAKTEGK